MIDVAVLDERIKKCLALLAENPQSRVFAALAESYRRLGEVGRAFSVCKNGLKIHPDYAQAHIVMAKLFLHQGMHEAALQSVERAVDIEGPSRMTELLEAEILIALDRLADARHLVGKLKAVDPNNPDVRDLAAKLRERSPRHKLPSVRSLFRHAPIEVPAAAVAQDEPHTDAPAETSGATVTHVAAPEATTWQDWVEESLRTPHARAAFAAGATGNIIAAKASVAELADSGEVLIAAFGELEQTCAGAGQGVVKEVRIETDAAVIWLQRCGDACCGFVGEAGMSFGGMRSDALARMNTIGAGADILKQRVATHAPGDQDAS